MFHFNRAEVTLFELSISHFPIGNYADGEIFYTHRWINIHPSRRSDTPGTQKGIGRKGKPKTLLSIQFNYDKIKIRKGGVKMNMQESSRLIIGLRAKGWTDTQIADFILYIESGDERYKPQPDTMQEDR